MKRLIHILVASVMVISMLLAACAQPAPSPTPTTTHTGTATPTPGVSPIPTATPGAPQYGGILKWGAGSASTSFIPRDATISNNARFLKAAYDTLLRLDENGELQPNLVTAWEFSPDYQSLTLTLRKGVKFHDGTDFDAAAAKWNIELRKAARRGDYESVESVAVIDDYTIRLNLSEYENTILTSLWFIGGMIQSPTSYEKYGADAATYNPVGTGPFRFVSFQRDVLINYERFDGYWQKGKPYLDGWNISFITDAVTRSFAFQKGEIHVADLIPGTNLQDLTKLGYPSLPTEINAYSYFLPDSVNADSPLSKLKVRQAIEYAVDRKGIAQTLGGGTTEALSQFSHVANYAYVAGLERGYDPAKARQLLTEAGYPNGFKTKIYVRSPAGDTVVAMATYLKEVGIDASIEAVSLAALTQVFQGGWQNGLVNRSMRVSPDWLKNANSVLTVNTPDNKSLLRPAGLEAKLEEALAARDFATRNARSQEIVKWVFDEAVVFPFTASQEGVVYQQNVHNIEWYGIWGPTITWSAADSWLNK